MNFLMKSEESAECHQTLSSQMESGHEIIPGLAHHTVCKMEGEGLGAIIRVSKYWSPKAFMEAEKFALTQD